MSLKVCRVCGLEARTETDLELFAKHKGYEYDRMPLCKECKCDYEKQYYANLSDEDKKKHNMISSAWINTEAGRKKFNDHMREYTKKRYHQKHLDARYYKTKDLGIATSQYL